MTMPSIRWRLSLIALAVLLLPSQGSSQTPAAIAIYVGPQTRDGFIDIDQGVTDSIADLKSELRRDRWRIVDKAEDAEVVLTVVARRLGTTSTIGMPLNGGTLMVPVNARVLETVLRVGAYEKPFNAEHRDGLWRECAKQIARDLRLWAIANQGKLRP